MLCVCLSDQVRTTRPAVNKYKKETVENVWEVCPGVTVTVMYSHGGPARLRHNGRTVACAESIASSYTGNESKRGFNFDDKREAVLKRLGVPYEKS